MRSARLAFTLVLTVLVGLVVTGGQASADVAKPTVGMWYSSWWSKRAPVPLTWINGFGVGSSNQLLGDVNGDGMDDAVVVVASTGAWYVALSSGSGFTYTGSQWGPAIGAGSTKQFLADVNGDGKQDAVAFTLSSGNWTVALSTGTGFGTPSIWIYGHGQGSTNQLVADATGDGKADAVAFWKSTGQWYVAGSTGSGFGYPSQWITGHGQNSTNQLMNDVDHDGRADAIVFFNSNGSWYVSHSTGTQFEPFYTQFGPTGNGIGSNAQFVTDGNGDGVSEPFSFFNGPGDWYAASYDRTYGGYGAPQLMNTGFGAGATKVFQGNVNGDPYGYKASVAYWNGYWYVQPYHWTNQNLYNRWANPSGRTITEVPYALGTYQTYDSGDTAVIDEQLATMSQAGVDFLILDATNGVHVDDGAIFARQQLVAARIAHWNSTPGNRPLKYALAVGLIQFANHDPSLVESDAAQAWTYFVSNPTYGGPANYFYKDGKPLLVLHSTYAQRTSWVNWGGDKTSSNRFTVRYSGTPATAGDYGWYTQAAGAIDDPNAMMVSPGVNNHASGASNVYYSRENGDYYSLKSWDHVLGRSQRPGVVTVPSFNEYGDGNAVAITDTSGVHDPAGDPHPTEKWFNHAGQIDNALYWTMTRDYIHRLSNTAFGATVAASSSVEPPTTTGWGKVQLTDGLGTTGYSSDASSTPIHTENVTVDLGSSQSISRVDLFPHGAGAGSSFAFPVDFTIQTSSDNATWTTVVNKTGYPRPAASAQPFTFAATSARYVRVVATKLSLDQPSGSNYRLQLNELEVYPADNLAYGATVTASSTEPGWIPGNLNDGSWASPYSSVSASETTEQWVKVDLGSTKTVSQVDLQPRNDAGYVGGGYPVDFTIQTSTDGMTWTTVVTRTNQFQPPNAAQRYAFAPTQARYVRVDATRLRSIANQFRLQLNEIEIH